MINKFKKIVGALFNTEPINWVSPALSHSIAGMVTEIGEIQDYIKKYTFYNKDFTDLEFKEELGDLLFYVESAAQAVNSSLDELMELMLAKHSVRYPDGVFDAACAKKRDKRGELMAMQKVERKYNEWR